MIKNYAYSDLCMYFTSQIVPFYDAKGVLRLGRVSSVIENDDEDGEHSFQYHPNIPGKNAWSSKTFRKPVGQFLDIPTWKGQFVQYQGTSIWVSVVGYRGMGKGVNNVHFKPYSVFGDMRNDILGVETSPDLYVEYIKANSFGRLFPSVPKALQLMSDGEENSVVLSDRIALMVNATQRLYRVSIAGHVSDWKSFGLNSLKASLGTVLSSTVNWE